MGSIPEIPHLLADALTRRTSSQQFAATGERGDVVGGWTALRRGLGTCLTLTKDLVHHVLDRCGGVDNHPVLRDVFFGLMPPDDEVAFRGLPAAPLLVRSRVKPPVQRGKVDLEDEDGVEEVEKLREVPRSTAEEGDRFPLVRGQGFHSVDIPEVVLVPPTHNRLPGFRVALVGPLAGAMNGLVAPPLEFIANGSLAGPGQAFD